MLHEQGREHCKIRARMPAMNPHPCHPPQLWWVTDLPAAGEKALQERCGVRAGARTTRQRLPLPPPEAPAVPGR